MRCRPAIAGLISVRAVLEASTEASSNSRIRRCTFCASALILSAAHGSGVSVGVAVAGTACVEGAPAQAASRAPAARMTVIEINVGNFILCRLHDPANFEGRLVGRPSDCIRLECESLLERENIDAGRDRRDTEQSLDGAL